MSQVVVGDTEYSIIWNRLDLNAPIHPGDRLIVYRDGLKPTPTDRAEDEGGADVSEVWTQESEDKDQESGVRSHGSE